MTEPAVAESSRETGTKRLLSAEHEAWLNQRISQRPPRKSLTEYSSIAPSLAATAKKLKRNFLENDLNQKLYAREDRGYLENRGIIQRNDIAPSLQDARRQLEYAFRRDQMNALLYSRPSKEELVARGIVPSGSRSSVVERTMKTLEHNMRIDKLRQLLESRPPRKSLTQRGILPEGNYSGNFAAIAAALQGNMRRDSLSKGLDERPSMEQLMRSGILENRRGIAPSLAATAKKLERNFIADDLNQKLYCREDRANLESKGIIKSRDVAPSLQDARRQLEYAFRRDQMNALLYARPPKEQLERRGILPSGRRSSIVERTLKDLEYNMKIDKLGQLLQKRPSIEELQHRGYYRGSYPYATKADIFEEDDDQFRGYSAPPQQRHEQPQHEYLQTRSKNFHLTRILLKFVASMAQTGKISIDQKGQLKDLVVDQDKTILAVAETFDVENDLSDFEDSLIRLASRSV